MNAKIYNGNVQPNPKEFKIWVNDEGIIKTWNGTEWIELSGASSDGSENNNAETILEYYRIDWLSVEKDNVTQDFKTELKDIPFAHYVTDGYGQYIGISPAYSVDSEGEILGVIYLKTFFIYYSAQHSGMKVAKANTLYDLLNIKYNGNADGLYKYFIPMTAEEYWSGWDVANLD